MRRTSSFLLVAVLALGCGGEQVSPPASAAKRSVDDFLRVWLIERDYATARSFFDSGYDGRDAGNITEWPVELRAFPRSARALRLAEHLGCTKGCAATEECIQRAGGGALYSRDSVVVGDQQVRQFGDLASLRGKKVDVISFLFTRCDTGAVLVTSGEDRVSVHFLAYVAKLGEK